MIEKLKPQITEKDGGAFGIIVERKFATDEEMQDKINELVDAVNALVYEHSDNSDWYDETRAKNVQKDTESRSENVQDLYAEQRKWIGKLCKFRDNYEDKWHFGVLEEIYERSDFPFGDFDNFEWAICEPVKPDDDIIYKKD